MMPEATGKAGLRGQFDIGQHADADHDRSAGKWRPSLRLTPVTLLPSLSMLVAWTPR